MLTPAVQPYHFLLACRCIQCYLCDVARWNYLNDSVFSAVPLSGNNLGQVVHTRVPLSPSSIIWYRSRGGDASGVALAMRHRLQWSIDLRSHGLRKGDEHPAMLSGNSLRQTVHTRRASVHQAAKLVAALLRGERVTGGK